MQAGSPSVAPRPLVKKGEFLNQSSIPFRYSVTFFQELAHLRVVEIISANTLDN
jgi:hypothetical protein